MRKVIDLFPTPFVMCKGVIEPELVERLRERALATQKDSNVRTDLLSHTEMIDPRREDIFGEVVPEVVHFGTLMFGEELDWTVKEMWMNVLERGGSQFMHSHANSFASGIIYLSELHPSTRTVFLRNMGANEFIFKNDPADGGINKFNGDKWVVPEVSPGDLVLYPSYLLHGVPPNQGGKRISLALNAIPDRLKSFGYEIKFTR